MKFKGGLNPDQEYLFARKTSDFLPEEHLAKAVYEITELLDLSSIESKYSEIGQHAYNPKMMTRIIFYGYSVGVRSSRKISKGCEERFDFVYLAGNLKPSHDRVSDFRRENLGELKEMFKEIVMIGLNLGLANIGNIKVSIDGTKIRANASAKQTKDEESLREVLKKTEIEINRMFEEAELIDAEEDAKYGKENRGDELPKHLRSRESRQRAIREAYEKLKRQKGEMKEKIKDGKGREPTQAELRKIEKIKINITDNEAKFMQERNGVIKPNYNAQLSVDEKEQFILANDVTDECTDVHQLVPMTIKTAKNIGYAPQKVKADNGYFAQLDNAVELFQETEFYVDDKHRRLGYINLYELREKYSDAKYKNLLRIVSHEGEKEYKKRMHTVEPPFGDMKHNLGYRHFLLRGIKKTKGEFNLMCVAHNIKKIFGFLTKKGVDLAPALLNIKQLIVSKRNCKLNFAC